MQTNTKPSNNQQHKDSRINVQYNKKIEINKKYSRIYREYVIKFNTKRESMINEMRRNSKNSYII